MYREVFYEVSANGYVWWVYLYMIIDVYAYHGELDQLVERPSASHAEGHFFDSCILQPYA